jgi:hypothetical protein
MKGKQHRLSPLTPLVSNVMGNFRIIEFISFMWQSSFRVVEIDQSETRIARGGHV